MLPLLREMRAASPVPIAAQPAAFRTTDTCHCFTRQPAFPDDLETIQVSRAEFIAFGRAARAIRGRAARRSCSIAAKSRRKVSARPTKT